MEVRWEENTLSSSMFKLVARHRNRWRRAFRLTVLNTGGPAAMKLSPVLVEWMFLRAAAGRLKVQLGPWTSEFPLRECKV